MPVTGSRSRSTGVRRRARFVAPQLDPARRCPRGPRRDDRHVRPRGGAAWRGTATSDTITRAASAAPRTNSSKMPKHAAAHDERLRPRRAMRPPGTGQHRAQAVRRSTRADSRSSCADGTGTLRSTSATTSPRRIPASCASGVSIERWASTGLGERLDVVGHDVVATLRRGACPGGALQAERGPRRHAEREPRDGGGSRRRGRRGSAFRLGATCTRARRRDHRLDVGRGRPPAGCRRARRASPCGVEDLELGRRGRDSRRTPA